MVDAIFFSVKKLKKGVDGDRQTLSFPFLPDGGVDARTDEKKLKKVLTGTSETLSFPFLPDRRDVL